MDEKEKLKKDLKRSKIMTCVCAVLLAIIIILLLLRYCDGSQNLLNDQNDPTTQSSPLFDPNQDPNIDWGDRDTKTEAEIQEELNNKVAEGMMNISMNTNPKFENGTSKGTLLIVNEEINRHPQIVQIYRDDTGELIYMSGSIPVGARIDYAELNVDLDAGTYACTAHFNQIDENGNLLGKACAKIIIDILG